MRHTRLLFLPLTVCLTLLLCRNALIRAAAGPPDDPGGISAPFFTEAPDAIPDEALIQPVRAAVARSGSLAMGQPTAWTKGCRLTAANCSDYRPAAAQNLTEGAEITFSALIPLTVTGLTPGVTDGEDNFRILEQAFALVHCFTEDPSGPYRDALFRITLPPGVYWIRCQDRETGCPRTLRLCRNLWLAMEGVTLCRADTSNAAMLRTCSEGAAEGYTGCGNLILQGGVWDAGMAHYSPGWENARFSTVRLGHGENILLTNMTFSGCVNGHHLELCGIRGCSVVNCTFRGYLDTAYRGSRDYKEAIQIDVVNNDAIAPSFPSYDDTVSRDVVVYGCAFRNLCRGVGGHNAVYGRYYSHIVVQHNLFSNLTAEAFYGLNYADTLISGNTMRNVGAGVTLLAMTPASDRNYFPPRRTPLPALEQLQYRDARITVADNRIRLRPFSPLQDPCGVLAAGSPYGGTVCRLQYGTGPFWLRGVQIMRNHIRAAPAHAITLRWADHIILRENFVIPFP